MKFIINFFKSVWNCFFGKKKTEKPHPAPINNRPVIKPQKAETIHSQSFRKQQLPGKIYNIGKSFFRIENKMELTASEKIRYKIIQS